MKSREGREFKFQGSQWVDKLGDPEFRQAVFDVMDEEVIMKFKERAGDAASFYDIDEEEEKNA